MGSKIKTCNLSLEANKQFPKSDKFSAKIFHMIAYFLFPGYTELFLCLGAGKSYNYDTDYILSCTYKYEGHADNCRGVLTTGMALEILLLFVCVLNCFQYLCTNCLDNWLYHTNNKASVTNCSKVFPSKEFVKILLLTAPLYIRREGLSVQSLGAAQGGSLWRNTQLPPWRGNLWQCVHTRHLKERGIFWQKKNKPVCL